MVFVIFKCHRMVVEICKWHLIVLEILNCHVMEFKIFKCLLLELEIKKCHNIEFEICKCYPMVNNVRLRQCATSSGKYLEDKNFLVMLSEHLHEASPDHNIYTGHVQTIS